MSEGVCPHCGFWTMELEDHMGDPIDAPVPIRQHSAKGHPTPIGQFDRRCDECGASFIYLAAGKTGERGIWDNKWHWWCSQECFDIAQVRP